MVLFPTMSKEKFVEQRDERERKADRLRSISAMSGFYAEARARKKRKKMNRHKKNH
jgi:hypothetical protein